VLGRIDVEHSADGGDDRRVELRSDGCGDAVSDVAAEAVEVERAGDAILRVAELLGPATPLLLPRAWPTVFLRTDQ